MTVRCDTFTVCFVLFIFAVLIATIAILIGAPIKDPSDKWIMVLELVFLGWAALYSLCFVVLQKIECRDDRLKYHRAFAGWTIPLSAIELVALGSASSLKHDPRVSHLPRVKKMISQLQRYSRAGNPLLIVVKTRGAPEDSRIIHAKPFAPSQCHALLGLLKSKGIDTAGI